jgi:Tfp pilus assembly protein PilO
MNLKDLNNISVEDLKNIDVSALKEKIQSRPDVIITILTITISIFATVFVYTKYETQAKSLNQQVNAFKEKNKVVAKHKKSQEEYNKFIKTFPDSLTIDEFSNKLSRTALAYDIRILDFKPTQKSNNDYFSYDGVAITISANEYEDLVDFIKEIESSSNTFRIESWKAGAGGQSNQSRRRKSEKTTSSTKVNSTITFGLLNLKL